MINESSPASPHAAPSPTTPTTPLGLLGGALLGAIPLAACGGSHESAASSEGAANAAASAATAQGQGLVIVVDPQNTTEKAPMRSDGTYELRPNFHDFGSVPDGETPSYVFRLRNTDPVPVAVKKLKPSCGCTVPSLRYLDDEGQLVHGLGHTVADRPHIVVPPGKVLEVEVQIDTREIKTKNADKLNTVTISTDSPNSYYLQLETHILVEAPFNVVPMTLDMGRIPRSAGGEGRVDLVPAAGFYGWRASGILEQPDDLFCELSHENVLGNDKWTLTSRFAAGVSPGRQLREVVVATRTADDGPGPNVKVPILAMVVDDIQFEPARFVFRAEPRQRFTVRMRSLLAGHRYAVVGALLPEEHRELLEVSYKGEDEDSDDRSATWLVSLMLPEIGEALDYPLRGKLLLQLDDPQHPEVEVGYVIHAPANGG